MPGPAPKHASLRTRRNRVAGARVLRSVPDGRVPALPADREWLPATRAFWAGVWASPMASEYLDSDVHGLLVLAVMVDAFWTEPTTQLAAEIRLQRRDFGLSPLDRSRLQWETAVVGASVEVTPEVGGRSDRVDPRRALEALK